MPFALRDPARGSFRSVRPPRGGALTLYVCGPTVYDDAHVGHARTYLYFDVARRHLEAEGVRVRHVMNVTDFEDKIFDRAQALGVSWPTLAHRMERRFWTELGLLGLRAPAVRPRASEHLREMLSVVRRLIRTGRAHREGDRWIYRAPTVRRRGFPTSDAVARHVLTEPGAPPPPGEDLREFVLWQPPHPAGPRWPSPWGPGTPGWHLECYVMARRYLGVPVDLHGGGRDLIFPHHYAENEIAHALDRRPFARHLLHTALVTQDGAKMSKSTGNLVPLRAAIARSGPGALRWYLLSRPYEQGLEWRPEGLELAGRELARARSTFAHALPTGGGGRLSLRGLRELSKVVAQELGSDLATDRALRAVSTYVG
ncbi:MAG TPA: class I tRNA ligase family protein, partial [Thermoplasmata archaeon]|nr:class I tRNA ligase family protein [Thermoplasmata archaeon]